MRMQKILTLITNTFYKEYRNKTLIFLFVFSLILIFMINAIMNLVLNPLEKAQLFIPGMLEKKLTVFYMIISIWGGFLATLLGVNCIRSDFDHRVASQLLSFPIKRTDYLLSRILGTWFLVVGYYGLSLLVAFIIFSYTNQDFSFGWHIPMSFISSSFALLVMITLGVIFSLFFSKTLALMGTLLLGFFITASNNFFLYKDNDYFKGISEGMITKSMIFLHFLFPRVGTINNLSRTLLSKDPVKLDFLIEVPHFLVSYGLIFILLLWIFQKKEHSW